MEFGTRSIRSAGQGSGSVEVTLPAAFRDLAGLPCHLALRDGLRPEIVLRPDLRAARAAFGRLWLLLAAALAAEVGTDPPLADCVVTLRPAEGARDAPRLAWTDGLALAGSPPHGGMPLARSAAALARMLAAPLGIAPALREGFGDACGFALAGHAPPGAEAACDIGAALLAAHGIAPGAPLAEANDHALSPRFAEAAAPALRRLRDAHLDWTADPPRHASLLAAWRRGVALELSGA